MLPVPTQLVGPRYNAHWSEAEDAELKRRFALGESATQIAIGMGMRSRNQVVGRWTRLGLKRSPPPRTLTHAGVAFANRQRGPRKKKPGSTLLNHAGEWKSSPQPPQPVMDEPAIFTLAKHIPLDELRSGLCHWPLWPNDRKPYDFDAVRYCGILCERGLSYCSYHADRAYAGAVKPNAWMMPKA